VPGSDTLRVSEVIRDRCVFAAVFCMVLFLWDGWENVESALALPGTSFQEPPQEPLEHPENGVSRFEWLRGGWIANRRFRGLGAVCLVTRMQPDAGEDLARVLSYRSYYKKSNIVLTNNIIRRIVLDER